MPDVNLLLAFAAGVLGFLSPCIVPLIPGYLSFVSGLSLAELPPADRRQHRVQPVLAAILTLAATSTRAAGGAILLLGYSLGLGVPFVITAVLLTGTIDALGWVRRHGRLIETASGAFLVAMGTALMFDLIFRLNTLILRLFPFRPAI